MSNTMLTCDRCNQEKPLVTVSCFGQANGTVYKICEECEMKEENDEE